MSTCPPFFLLLFLGLGLVHSALAQAERSLEDRLLRPDRNQISSLDGRVFRGAASFQGQEYRPAGQDTWSQRRVQTAAVEQRRFLGIPIPFTQQRQVTTWSNSMADREFVTQAAALVQEARDNRRPYREGQQLFERSGAPSAWDGKIAHFEGTHQENLNRRSRELTPEDVRALLNKNVPPFSSPNGSSFP